MPAGERDFNQLDPGHCYNDSGCVYIYHSRNVLRFIHYNYYLGRTPTGAWASAITKAKAAVAKLTLDQKVSLGTGVQWQKGHCVGNTPAISSINFPGLCLQDSPLGVRYADKVSVFPAGINVAATFNRDLMKKRGESLGAEFKGKGVHVALGPAVNIARAPAAGRNWEGFGADPYLAGEAAYATVVGIQSQGVQACAKHYVNNEQEHFRESSSSNVDDRTPHLTPNHQQHEIYLPPFLKAVQAGVASFMCSYINGTYACENSNILNNLLKTELGFQGYVMSDWWATHSGATSVNAGLDMTMPGDVTLGSGTTYFGSNIVSAVQNGQVSQTRIDDLATRILAAWYLLGQDSGYPAVNFDSWNINDGFNQHVNVQGDHASTIGAASTVLLKNKNSTLPLKTPSTIAVVGNDAGPNSQGINGCSDRSCNNGILAQGWGSGTAEYPYLINPLDAIKTKASSIGATVTSSLSDSDLTTAANTARGKDVALVFISADSGEGYITVEGHAGDRNDLKAWHNGDALVAAVAAVNKNTVVVVHAVGPIIMESWIDHANVTAVLWAGLQGQEAGNSIVDVLWGAVNPSGRLPYTIAKSAADYPVSVITSGSGIVQIPYSEGLKVDYRAFDANNITPRFEFGFGLSYTTFAYSNLVVTPGASGGTQPTGPGSVLSSWLHDPWVQVTFTLQNTGTVAGTEIPQLYISPPSSSGEPPNALKGFSSVSLQPGASTQVSMTLSRLDTHGAKSLLRKAFAKNPNPSEEELEKLSKECGRPTRIVSKWFERERAKTWGTRRALSASIPGTPNTLDSIRDDVDAPLHLAVSRNLSRFQRANSTMSDQSHQDDQWEQYPPPSAEDIPNMAFGSLPKPQHELHCAMALYHLATLGLPMTLSAEPR
ncbi:Glycoside hydrolase family 3 protein [Ceratobasidium theobromae]|uniref:beta-glucosidase n=1 Tax=Ceratobasidium theobromae TaxID=1582974 RepID=A0A5N5QQK7_9AGAM|nr:Glycoside hydrolase family 3 protein [Ceratobasidium theobromae]